MTIIYGCIVIAEGSVGCGAIQRKGVWHFCIATWVCGGILHSDDKDWKKGVGQDNTEMLK